MTVVSNATVNASANVTISPEPNAANPGPKGIKVPKRPKIGPTLTRTSVLLVLLINLVSSAEINSLANAFLASLPIS